MLAMHRSGLKFSLRSWVLTQGLTSAQGKFARSRNQRGITTLCATCQRENPVLSTSCSPCVHMKWRARIQIYINKLFNWFFFSLLSCVINPAEFQSSSVCLQSMSIFTPTDGFSFSYLSRAFFFQEWTFEIPHSETICSQLTATCCLCFYYPTLAFIQSSSQSVKNLNSQKTNLTKKLDGFLLVYFCELEYGGRGRAGGLPIVAGSCWICKAVVWNNSLRSDQLCVSLVTPENAVWNKILPMAENK